MGFLLKRASFLKRIIKEAGSLTHERNCLFPLRLLYVNLCPSGSCLHYIEEAASSLQRRVLSFKHDADPCLQNSLDRAPEPASLPLPHPKLRLLA